MFHVDGFNTSTLPVLHHYHTLSIVDTHEYVFEVSRKVFHVDGFNTSTLPALHHYSTLPIVDRHEYDLK